MTDAYVERLIINKFLELGSIDAVSKCHQYYQENKENPDCLPAFEYFKPEYTPGMTDEEKFKADGPKELELIKWYKEIYPNFYQTEEGSPEDDELYDAIKETIIIRDNTKQIKRKLELYDAEQNKKILMPIYSVVFENSVEERSEISEAYTNPWYEIYFHPTAPNQIELGGKGRIRWTGFLQVNICVPNNWGTDAILDRYDEIAQLFRPGLIMEGVRIVRTYRGPNMTEDDFIWCPVTIDWQSDLDR